MRLRLGNLRVLLREAVSGDDPIWEALLVACGPGDERAARRDKIIRRIELHAGHVMNDLRVECHRLATGYEGGTTMAKVLDAYYDAMEQVPDRQALLHDLIGKLGSL